MTNASQISVHALGGPTAILEIGGLRLLTDPTFDAPREYVAGPGRVLVKTAPTALTSAEIGPVDAVLLSHDQHVDNLDIGGRAYLGQVPLVLTTASAAGRLGGATRAVPVWEHVDLPRPDGSALRVTRVPALHGPEGSEPLVGEVAGFVLSGPEAPTVYVSGDNASLDLVARIAERFAVDVAVLFAGAARTPLVGDAYLTLTSAQAAEAARILGASHVVPLHFDSWGHFTEGADALTKAFAQAGLTDRLTLLHPGERAALTTT
ncbi:MBL fold metallo-hydrolase [Microbispora sp. SCL1-1]|uniref:MBL fold metallo-hydrolase n=1 Tax=Microbispora hainanensis TaxID=568844 RepID=A0ABZ1SMW9_9ACTN|nr:MULTISPECIES: MBL fold metallo-hydrolase [Microbispora]NJP29192.1 MBL fold metallo-hydrolase [Microbispora sp. CL1-1]TQS06012.1 MBL fold metallo-hydrolase [Microbispora sp. SCL1-1]